MQRQQCQNCLADRSKDKTVLLCGGCRKARYCDKSCQKAHWKEHKQVCKDRARIKYVKIDTPRGSFTMQDLQDFCAVHRAAMCTAGILAMGTYLDPPPCDEMKSIMYFDVKYEPAFHHIPGRRFSLLDAGVVPQEQFDHSSMAAAINLQRSFQLGKKERNPTRHYFLQVVHAEHMSNLLPAECNDYIVRGEGADPPANWKSWLEEQFASGSSGSDNL